MVSKMTILEERESLTLINQNKKIFGILHFPSHSQEPVPAVVICPGFGGNKSGKFRVFVSLAQELVKQGIAVLRFDYRGAGDSEGEFSEMTINSQVNDALICLNHLKKDIRIDASRMGLLGRSLGGMIAVLAANQFPNLKSIALWAPVFSSGPWKKIFETLSFASKEVLEKGARFYLPSNIPAIPSTDFLKQFFQVNLDKELSQLSHLPLLHIHGKKDEFVKFDQALEYEKTCEKYAKTYFIHLPHSDHDFSLEDERKIAITKTCEWFKDTL